MTVQAPYKGFEITVIHSLRGFLLAHPYEPRSHAIRQTYVKHGGLSDLTDMLDAAKDYIDNLSRR
jgi:hypothetical protein